MGREEGGGFRMGNTCIPVTKVVCQPLQYSCLDNPMNSKQPRCPSADEWIIKLWYIYTMDYYSAIKKNVLNQF